MSNAYVCTQKMSTLLKHGVRILNGRTYKCQIRSLKGGYRRHRWAYKTAKINRFVLFVMYCFITTVALLLTKFRLSQLQAICFHYCSYTITNDLWGHLWLHTLQEFPVGFSRFFATPMPWKSRKITIY